MPQEENITALRAVFPVSSCGIICLHKKHFPKLSVRGNKEVFSKSLFRFLTTMQKGRRQQIKNLLTPPLWYLF